MLVYVIEFVIKLVVIYFENNIKNLLNIFTRIPVNGIVQCGIETHNIHRKFLPIFRSLVPGHRYIITKDSMIGSQLMGLGNVSAKIYNIHVYFQRLTIGQWALGF